VVIMNDGTGKMVVGVVVVRRILSKYAPSDRVPGGAILYVKKNSIGTMSI
jgi:hypothetical protein